MGDDFKAKRTNRPLPHLAGKPNPVVQSNQQGKTSGNLHGTRYSEARSLAAKNMNGKKGD